MRLMSVNLADDATLTTTGAHANYPDTNIQHPHLSRYCRSDGTSLTIVFDLGSAQDFTAFCLAEHNFSDSATVTFEANSSDSWVAPAYQLSITNLYDVICEFFTEKTYRYCRLVISDASNSDGYVKVGRVYIGEYTQMPYMDRIFELPRVTNTQIKNSPGGQTFANEGVDWVEFRASLLAITWSTKTTLDPILKAAVKAGAPVFLAVWEESFSTQPCLYGAIKMSDVPWQFAGDETFTLIFEFRETK